MRATVVGRAPGMEPKASDADVQDMLIVDGKLPPELARSLTGARLERAVYLVQRGDPLESVVAELGRMPVRREPVETQPSRGVAATVTAPAVPAQRVVTGSGRAPVAGVAATEADPSDQDERVAPRPADTSRSVGAVARGPGFGPSPSVPAPFETARRAGRPGPVVVDPTVEQTPAYRNTSRGRQTMGDRAEKVGAGAS